MVLVYGEVEFTDNDVRGNEPAYGHDGEVMGIATSGASGCTVDKNLALVYVAAEYESPGSIFMLELLGQQRRATVLAEAAYDPCNLAPRSRTGCHDRRQPPMQQVYDTALQLLAELGHGLTRARVRGPGHRGWYRGRRQRVGLARL